MDSRPTWARCIKRLNSRNKVLLALFWALSGVVIPMILPEHLKIIGAFAIWGSLALFLVFQALKSIRVTITPLERPETFSETSEERVVKVALLLVPAVVVGSVYWLYALQDGSETIKQASPVAAEPALLSIDCSPINLPVPGKHPQDLSAIYLHPKWGNQMVKFMYGTAPEATYWPNADTRGAAYRCKIINIGSARLTQISLPLRVRFRSEVNKRPSRTVEAGVPDLSPKDDFLFYIFDDSGSDPEVTLPEFAQGQMSGTSKSIVISVERGSRRIAGFGL